MVHLPKIVSSFQTLTIFANRSILYAWYGSEYAFEFLQEKEVHVFWEKFRDDWVPSMKTSQK